MVWVESVNLDTETWPFLRLDLDLNLGTGH